MNLGLKGLHVHHEILFILSRLLPQSLQKSQNDSGGNSADHDMSEGEFFLC